MCICSTKIFIICQFWFVSQVIACAIVFSSYSFTPLNELQNDYEEEDSEGDEKEKFSLGE